MTQTSPPSTPNDRPSRFHVRLAMALLLLAALITSPPAVDQTVARWFGDPALPGVWHGKEQQPWLWIYEHGPKVGWAMVYASIAGLLVGLFRPAWRVHRWRFLAMVLSAILGPWLLVNELLKRCWGRDRPAELLPFGGSHDFQPWWHPLGPSGGASFVSGHVSMAMVLVTIALVLPRRYRMGRALVFTVMIVYAVLTAYARMAQGGHFFSDTLISAALTYLVAAGVVAWLEPRAIADPADVTPGSGPRTSS
ncbi:MAG: phosphatase PAP2 family protein [Phycisphaeraceae bacterium]|nr:phosphatase PAP2 family protein [Phycisphaeraceae bacterium]